MIDVRKFQEINWERAERWHKDTKWDVGEWCLAMCGEAGETANVCKKMLRSRDGLTGNRETDEELRQALADEIADTVIYAACLASQAGISLETAIRSKFNRTSEKNGFLERL